MRDIPDCNITVATSSMMSAFSASNDLQVILQSSQLDELKEASDSLVNELTQYPGLIKVHSDLENAAPVIKVHVDPIEAAGRSCAGICGRASQQYVKRCKGDDHGRRR